MPAENKAVIQRFYNEVVNKGNLQQADALMSAGFIDHSGAQESVGLEAFKRFVTMLAGAFPDIRVTVEDLFGDGDKVTARLTVRGTHKGTLMGSIPATGKQAVWTGIDIFRIQDGKIAERWNQRDLLGLMQQLGVVGR